MPRKGKRNSHLQNRRKKSLFPAKRKRTCDDKSAKVTIEGEIVGRKRIGFRKTSLDDDSSVDPESELESSWKGSDEESDEESGSDDGSVGTKVSGNSILSSSTTRMAVAYLFVKKYDGLSNSNGGIVSCWNGRGGIIPKLRTDLGMKKTCGYKFEPILMEILECARSGMKFCPEKLETRGGKRPCTFELDSIEAQIVADACESGLSTEKALTCLNAHLFEEGRSLTNKSAVISLIVRLNPQLKRVRKRKQGSHDPNSPWARARVLTTKQLLVRLGELKPEEPLENKFDPEKLGTFDIDQIVWWDETHRKCLIGGISSSRDFCLQFKRDENGKLDFQNGEYSNKEIKKLNVKYEDEGRFGLGCALVTPIDEAGNEVPQVGKRCQLFDYSGKLLISPDDFDLKIQQEFRRVKSLSSNNNYYWIESTVPKKTILCSSPVISLPSIGKKAVKILEEQNISKVGDLKQKTDEEISALKGITANMMKKFIPSVRQASDQVNTTIDHRKADNPYLSKFGEQHWLRHLKESSKMKSVALITDYVDHIWKESERVMQGTKHQDDWYVFHDALKIMTSKANKAWMQEKGYLKRWILPSEDLYDHDRQLKKAYNGNPIGNSPELMPWDCHLNQDVHLAHDHHVIITRHLSEDDPLKFSGSSPNRIAKSYTRLLAPDESGIAPTSERIIHDIKEVVSSLKAIYNAKGVIIEGLGNRSGRRFEMGSKGDKRGGARKRKTQQQLTSEFKDMPLHSDAQLADQMELNRKREEWSGELSCVPEVCCNSPETKASELTGSPNETFVRKETTV